MASVLVIAYYFPPMGLSGVQRITKFVKYLPAYGWEPTVLTVEPAGYFAYDTSLMDDVESVAAVHRTATWDPTRLFGRRTTVALPSEGRRRSLSLLSQWVFVPDNKIGWMIPALQRGRDVLRSSAFDAVLSTAPPYTAHLIASSLSRQFRLPLVVDFRDDWVGNPRHVYPTRLHRRLSEHLERRVLRRSRHVVTINEVIRSGLLSRNPGVPEEALTVIPQGFDADDLRIQPVVRTRPVCRFVYCGIFYDAQTPDFFLEGLARLLAVRPGDRERVEAVFVGLLPEASRALVERLGLGDVVRYEGYLDHDQAVAHERAADVLWMTIGRRNGAEGISTGKLFEYMGTRKPILALVPEGVAREALVPYGAARIVEPDAVGAIAEALAGLVDAWASGSLPQPHEAYVETYDRRRLTGALAGILDRVAGRA